LALLLDQITVGASRIAVLDSDPNAGDGYLAETGSIALVPSTAKLFFKTASLDTDWTEVATAANITEQVQDAVAGALTDSADIEFLYNDALDQISAQLSLSGVTAGSYGSASDSVSITVDSKGRITSLSVTPIAIASSQITDFQEAAQDAAGAALTDTATVNLTYDDANNQIKADVIQSGLDHGSIGGLSDDDHAQYALLAGRGAGQVLNGGTGSANTLTLSSTSDSSKGKILLGSNVVVDEATTRFGIGTASPSAPLEVVSSSSIFKVLQSSVVTTNNTTTTLLSYSIPLNKGVFVKAFIVGSDNTTKVIAYERTAAARNLGGVGSQVGVTQSDFTEENTGVTISNATIDVSGTDVRVRVTGVSGVTINWYCTVQVVTF
jgi:hypothetical protein